MKAASKIVKVAKVDSLSTKGKAMLSKGVQNALAEAIVDATDERGYVTTFRERVVQIGKTAKLPMGKPLSLPDAEAIADECERRYRAAGHTSIKSLKSVALKLAQCAPILARLENSFAGIGPMKEFSTHLRKANFDVKAANKSYKAALAAKEKAKSDPKKIMQRAAATMIDALAGKNAAASRAVLVLAFETLRIDLGARTEHRNVALARKTISQSFG